MPDGDVSDRVLLSGRSDTPLVADTPVLPARRTDDIRLFKASGVPDGRRLRLAVLDLYDGAAWVPAEDSPGSDGYGTFKRVGSAVTALHPGTTAVVRVRFRPGYSSDWLPMLGELTSIDLDFNPGRTDVGDVRYNQATASALVLGGVDVRDEYRFESVRGGRELHPPGPDARADRGAATAGRGVPRRLPAALRPPRAAPAGAGPAAGPLPPDPRHGADHRDLRPVARHARPPHAGIATDDRHRLPVQRPHGARGFPARRGRAAW